MPSRRQPAAAWLLLAALGASAPTGAQVLQSGPPSPVPGTPGPQAPSSPPQVQSGVIAGAVFDAATGAPIPGAVVYLHRDPRDTAFMMRQVRQLTDSQGRFAFTDLAASDRYVVSAAQFGFFDGGFGAANEPGMDTRTISLADGQWITNHRVLLHRPASVSGTVTDEGGEPVVGAYVRVLTRIFVAGRPHLASGPSATTDDRGFYRISNLPPGQYVVSIPSVSQSMQNADLAQAIAPPGGNTSMAGGAPSTRPDTSGPEPSLDLGTSIRLVLGRFAVPPPPRNGQVFTYPMTFYGGANVAQAVTLDLRLGDERVGLDIKLEPVATTTVSGTVQGSSKTLARLTLRLLAAGLETVGEGNETATAAVAADGSFTFYAVPAGNYTIDAPSFISEYLVNSSSFTSRPPTRLSNGWSSGSVASGPPGTQIMRGRSRPDPLTWARVPVAVTNQPLTDVVIAMKPTAAISGKVEYDTDPGQPEAKLPTFVALRAEPANGDPGLGQGDSARFDNTTGEFTIEGLLGGAYLLRGVSSAAWQVKSVVAGGRDLTHQPFDTSGGDVTGVVVTLTNRQQEIFGTVRDAQGAIAPESMVVVFPAEPAQWSDYGLSAPRFRSVTVRADGTYRIGNLPAGDYFAVAIGGSNANQWQTPGFFKNVSSLATRVVIGWSGKQAQDLRALPAGAGAGR